MGLLLVGAVPLRVILDWSGLPFGHPFGYLSFLYAFIIRRDIKVYNFSNSLIFGDYYKIRSSDRD